MDQSKIYTSPVDLDIAMTLTKHLDIQLIDTTLISLACSTNNNFGFLPQVKIV